MKDEGLLWRRISTRAIGRRGVGIDEVRGGSFKDYLSNENMCLCVILLSYE